MSNNTTYQLLQDSSLKYGTFLEFTVRCVVKLNAKMHMILMFIHSFIILQN